METQFVRLWDFSCIYGLRPSIVLLWGNNNEDIGTREGSTGPNDRQEDNTGMSGASGAVNILI